MGLSAGALSRTILGWVRNITKDKKNLEKQEQINIDASSAFAVLWGLARTLLLPEIVNDFKHWLETIGSKYWMDGNGTMGTGDGRGKWGIALGREGRRFEFTNAELAPPAGVMAENYCRCVPFVCC